MTVVSASAVGSWVVMRIFLVVLWLMHNHDSCMTLMFASRLLICLTQMVSFTALSRKILMVHKLTISSITGMRIFVPEQTLKHLTSLIDHILSKISADGFLLKPKWHLCLLCTQLTRFKYLSQENTYMFQCQYYANWL